MQRVRFDPALVLCSVATRARETLEAITPALGSGVEVLLEGELYHADAGDLLSRLRRLPDRSRDVLLIGHNPALQDLAVQLARGGDEKALRRLEQKFPTAALATLTMSCAWRDLTPGAASLESFVVPRELED